MSSAYTLDDWKAGKPPPDGWDVADACADGWSKDEIDAFMRATVRPWSPPAAPQPVATEPPQVTPPRSVPQREARTTQQAKPATVTHIQTRVTVEADDAWRMNLLMNEDGNKIKPGATLNWSLYLEHHDDMRGVFAFDAFKMRVMLMRRPPWEKKTASWTPRVLQDRDYSEAVMWLEARHMTPKQSNIPPVIQTVAEHASFDRLREYLEDGVKWDGEPRVEAFASKYLGSDDTPYSRTVAMRWLVSSVARGLRPGCKVDTMPILEGPQGAKKSTAVRALYGDEFFTDELSDIGSKDAMMEMQGVWCLEIAEMHRFNISDTNAVKKFLSRQTDRFRPPYGRAVIEAPRRVVLNGTMNPDGNAYLKDPTGARRFWPLICGRIDIDGIARDRDQLWAEAVHMFNAGVPWWVQDDESEAVRIEQEKRTDVDVWMDVIAPLVKKRTSISQGEIFSELGLAKKDIDYRHAGRVGRIMKSLGWTAARDRTDGGDKTVFYAPRGTSLDLDDGLARDLKGDW